MHSLHSHRLTWHEKHILSGRHAERIQTLVYLSLPHFESLVSPTKNFTFDQLEMNDYSVYEKMCNVPSNIIESHKSAFKMG